MKEDQLVFDSAQKVKANSERKCGVITNCLLKVPEVEFVSVPDAIKKEKDVVCDLSGDMWYRSSYRKQQLEDLARHIKKIKPHCVEDNDLVVIGKGLCSEKKVK